MIGGTLSGAISGGTVKSAVTGGVSGALLAGVGLAKLDGVVRVGACATAGGISSAIAGGNFQSGFLAAGFTAGLDAGVGPKLPDMGPIGNGIGRGIIGGTAAVIAGGRFEQGAISAALQYAISESAKAALRSDRETAITRTSMGGSWPADTQLACGPACATAIGELVVYGSAPKLAPIGFLGAGAIAVTYYAFGSTTVAPGTCESIGADPNLRHQMGVDASIADYQSRGYIYVSPGPVTVDVPGFDTPRVYDFLVGDPESGTNIGAEVKTTLYDTIRLNPAQVARDVSVVENGGLARTLQIPVNGVGYTTYCFACALVPNVNSAALRGALQAAQVPFTHGGYPGQSLP